MLWIQKIKLRRKVLLQEEESNGDKVVIPSLEIEESRTAIKFDLGGVPESNQSEAFEKALIELIIPRAVYRNAVKAIPKDLDFRKGFVSIYEQFGIKEHDAVDDIYSGISADFQDFESCAFICKRFIQGIAVNDPVFPQKLKKTITAFEELLSSSQSGEFLELYVSFLKSTKTDCQDIHLVITITDSSNNIFQSYFLEFMN
jgi:U3 small nucleolar RNA-associated protein 6